MTHLEKKFTRGFPPEFLGLASPFWGGTLPWWTPPWGGFIIIGPPCCTAPAGRPWVTPPGPAILKLPGPKDPPVISPIPTCPLSTVTFPDDPSNVSEK